MVNNISSSQHAIKNLNDLLKNLELSENKTEDTVNQIFVHFLEALMEAQTNDVLFHAKHPNFLTKAWEILSNYELEEKITQLFLRHFFTVKVGSSSLIQNLASQLWAGFEKMNYPLISELFKLFNEHQLDIHEWIQTTQFNPYAEVCRLYDESNPQHLKILQLLDSHNITPNKPSFQRTPLFIACQKGSYFLVNHLKEQGVDLNIVDNSGNNSLHFLKENPENQEDVFKIVALFDKESINLSNHAGYSPLMLAIHEGQFSVVKALTQSGADLHFINPRNGNSAMHMAAWGNNNARFLIPFLKNNQASLEVRNSNGLTPLACCCHFLLGEQATIFIDNGADVFNNQNRAEGNLLHLLLENLEGLIQRLPSRNFLEAEEIIYAKCDKILVIFDLLTSKEIPFEYINYQDSSGATPLHYACHGPELDNSVPKPMKEKIHAMMEHIIKTLLEKGAESNRMTKRGELPYDFLMENDSEFYGKILQNTAFFDPFTSPEVGAEFARKLDLPLRETRLIYGTQEDLEAFLSENIELSDLDLLEWDSLKHKINVENMDSITEGFKSKIKESREALVSLENFLKETKLSVSVAERMQKAHNHLNRVEKELNELIIELYSKANEPSPDFICLITQQIMKNPCRIQTKDAEDKIVDEMQWYEHEAITKWFQENGTSPCTRNRIVNIILDPELRAKIEEYKGNMKVLIKRTLERKAPSPKKQKL